MGVWHPCVPVCALWSQAARGLGLLLMPLDASPLCSLAAALFFLSVRLWR